MTNLGNKNVMAHNIVRLMSINNVDRNDISKALNMPYTTVVIIMSIGLANSLWEIRNNR